MVYFCLSKGFIIMKKAERTRNFIIETSAAIINKKGMAGTSLSDIMEATKLAKGGIYGNFESKEAICEASFFYLTGKLAAVLDKAVNEGDSAREKFFNLLEVYKGNKNLVGGCPLLNFGVEADDTNPAMKANVKKAIQSSQKRIFNIIADGISRKELSAEINPKIFSVKVFAMIEGAILCRKMMDSDEQMKIIMEAIKKEFEGYLV